MESPKDLEDVQGQLRKADADIYHTIFFQRAGISNVKEGADPEEKESRNEAEIMSDAALKE